MRRTLAVESPSLINGSATSSFSDKRGSSFLRVLEESRSQAPSHQEVFLPVRSVPLSLEVDIVPVDAHLLSESPLD